MTNTKISQWYFCIWFVLYYCVLVLFVLLVFCFLIMVNNFFLFWWVLVFDYILMCVCECVCDCVSMIVCSWAFLGFCFFSFLILVCLFFLGWLVCQFFFPNEKRMKECNWVDEEVQRSWSEKCNQNICYELIYFLFSKVL